MPLFVPIIIFTFVQAMHIKSFINNSNAMFPSIPYTLAVFELGSLRGQGLS
jgi:hypothetical protein